MLSSCTPECVKFSSENAKKKYDILGQAIVFSSSKLEAKYYPNYPIDFNAKKFIKFVKNKIPEDYYEELTKYSLKVESKGKYYLLIARDPKCKNVLVLFDYSCSPELDGPIYRNRKKYNLKNREIYNDCK